jgi:hypothetical protein
MARRGTGLSRVAGAGKLAAINSIFESLTDSERRHFAEWQKKNVGPGSRTTAFDWPGLKPYLAALVEEIQSELNK